MTKRNLVNPNVNHRAIMQMPTYASFNEGYYKHWEHEMHYVALFFKMAIAPACMQLCNEY